MDGHVKDAPLAAPAEPLAGGFSFNDIDMTPVHRLINVSGQGDGRGNPDDGIPRPPYDPLSTGQKLAGVIDVAGALGGGYFAMGKFRDNGLNVLQADVKSLDRLANSPELHEYRALGSSLSGKTSALTASAKDDVLAMQVSKPQLFDDLVARSSWKGFNLKQPRYGMMEPAERAIVDRATNLEYISENLRRAINTSNTANFKSKMTMLTDLHKNPTAMAEGLSPELRELEDLSLKVNERCATSTISMAAESRAVLLKNAGIIGAGIATNAIIEKTLLKDSAPKGLTIAADVASPFIVLTELPLWAKFGVIVGAHAVARLSEYGMAKGQSDK